MKQFGDFTSLTLLSPLFHDQNLLIPINGCTLGKLHQHSFPKNLKRSSETLGLIHSDLLELPTLSYSKYKWVITFLDDYSFYCRVAFLCKKLDAAGAIKAIFRLW